MGLSRAGSALGLREGTGDPHGWDPSCIPALWLRWPSAWHKTACRDPAMACGSDEFISIYDLL